MDTDATIGAVLSKVQEGMELVVGHFNKTLGDSQRNDSTTMKERLAIAAALDHWLVRHS